MDDAVVNTAVLATKLEVASKEAASVAAGVGGSSEGPPPFFALQRTLPLPGFPEPVGEAMTMPVHPCPEPTPSPASPAIVSKPLPGEDEVSVLEPEASESPEQETNEEESTARPASLASPAGLSDPGPQCPEGESMEVDESEDNEPGNDRPVLAGKGMVVSPAEQNELAKKNRTGKGKGKGKRKRQQSGHSNAEEIEGAEQEAKKQAKSKAKASPKGKAKAAKKPKAKASPKGKAKAGLKPKSRSTSKSEKQDPASTPTKQQPLTDASEDDETSDSTKHYSPKPQQVQSKTKHQKKATPKAKQQKQPKAKGKAGKKATKDDPDSDRKAMLSRKSSAYHKARNAALKKGASKEKAKAAGKKATGMNLHMTFEVLTQFI